MIAIVPVETQTPKCREKQANYRYGYAYSRT